MDFPHFPHSRGERYRPVLAEPVSSGLCTMWPVYRAMSPPHMGLTVTALCRAGCVCSICHLGHKCVTRKCFFSAVTARKWGEPQSEPALLPHVACGRCLLGEHIHPHNLSLADSLIHPLDTVEHLLITRRAAGPGGEVGRAEP